MPLGDGDSATLNRFDEVAKAPENRLAFHLERGDMLLINNYTILHAPGRERHLVRLWLDAPGFRDVPKAFNLFKTNGIPALIGRAR